MSDIDLAELKRLAQAVEPEYSSCASLVRFQEVANPAAVLALIERVGRAEKERDATFDMLKVAHAAMEHMGDTLNDMDAVDGDDPKDAAAIEAFERVNAFLEAK
ncbi:hypothetical protein Mx8p32 [Myxococcus phage Mx8]|uniref:p32 n=1 Tax=Myxococcus phage Mx8 TaxID=49964 RepID=Q94MT7_9CAUD|nr:hypothetical protein Mx8p32 [Myxococcus phage Mx8]AAK94367.1 p32 [Myxococcus phage Mx8]